MTDEYEPAKCSICLDGVDPESGEICGACGGRDTYPTRIEEEPMDDEKPLAEKEPPVPTGPAFPIHCWHEMRLLWRQLPKEAEYAYGLQLRDFRRLRDEAGLSMSDEDLAAMVWHAWIPAGALISTTSGVEDPEDRYFSFNAKYAYWWTAKDALSPDVQPTPSAVRVDTLSEYLEAMSMGSTFERHMGTGCMVKRITPGMFQMAVPTGEGLQFDMINVSVYSAGISDLAKHPDDEADEP